MDLIQIKSKNPSIVGFAESRIGGRSENQDSFDFADTPRGFLVTVCDGMGGGPGGKTASTIAVREIIAGVMESDEQESVSNILIKAIRRANMAIINKGVENPELHGMGSTCTVLLVNEQSATIAHVGDSRVYQLRGKSKIFRTFDHSMVFDLVKQKVITEEQARLSVQSNIITRALGIKPDLEVEITERPYESGDRFLLCTDGIHGSVDEKTLIKMMTSSKEGTLRNTVDSVAMEIDNIGVNSGGGHDNLTLAVIKIMSDSLMKEKMSKRFKQILMVLAIVCVCSLLANIYLIIQSKNHSNEFEDTKELQSLKECNENYLNQIKTYKKDSVAFYQLIKNLENDSKNKKVVKLIKEKLNIK